MLYNQLKKCIDEYTKIKHVLTVDEGNGGHAGNGGQQKLKSVNLPSCLLQICTNTVN